MNDEELIEALRRTLHHRAQRVRPGPPRPLEISGRGSRARRAPSPYRLPPRRTFLAGLATVAVGGVIAAIALIPSGPSHTQVGILGTPPSSGLTTPTTANRVVAPVPTTVPAPVIPSSPMPAGFEPRSVTFVSAHTGWVLGSAPCSTGVCAVLSRTTDGGATWRSVPVPGGVSVSSSGSSGPLVRFADLDDGWIVSSTSQVSSLWSTHNGGLSWQSIPTPGGTGLIEDLEASNLIAQMVMENSQNQYEVFDSPAGTNDWTGSPVTISVGAGPIPSSSVTLFGSTGWITDIDRTTVGGARLTNGTWTSWTPACSDATGSGYVAASSAQDLVAVCNEGAYGSPAPGTTSNTPWLYSSTDGGSTFSRVSQLPSSAGSLVDAVAAAAGVPTTIVAAVNQEGLVASFNRGRTWSVVYPTSSESIDFVGFTTSSQGVAVATNQAGSTSTTTLLMTYNGGHNWTPVRF